MYLIDEYCSVNKGLKLDINQDNIYVNGYYLPQNNNGIKNYEQKKVKLNKDLYYAVFDGIGGLEKGDYASVLCSQTLNDIKDKNEDIITNINEKLLEVMNNTNINFGSTAAIVKINKKNIELNLVGDSSVFILSNGVLTKYIEKEGTSDYLENYVGTKNISIKKENIKLNVGDKIIICSDGLTKEVKEAEIEYTMDSSNNSKYITDKLINYALKSGGNDNISVITLIVKKSFPYYIYVLAILSLALLIIGLITI